MRKQTISSSLAFAALSVAAQAAVVVTTANQLGDGINLFTPTFTPSSTDLINGASPTSSAGNFTLEASTGVSALTDGSFPALSTGVVGAHLGLATAGNGGGSGTQVTYAFTTINISHIDVFGGWNDSGRDEINFSVQFSTDGGTTFGTAIPSGSFNPSIASGIQSANHVRISDDAGPLASGVNAIRVNFLDVENGYTGYAEIDVVAVPEPSSFALLGLSLTALAARRRRR